MKDDKQPFPCCDLIREARLEGQELIHNLSRMLAKLKNTTTLGDEMNDEDGARKKAKEAKEEICTMINELMKIRDKITFWQAWASDNSPLE